MDNKIAIERARSMFSNAVTLIDGKVNVAKLRGIDAAILRAACATVAKFDEANVRKLFRQRYVVAKQAAVILGMPTYTSRAKLEAIGIRGHIVRGASEAIFETAAVIAARGQVGTLRRVGKLLKE